MSAVCKMRILKRAVSKRGDMYIDTVISMFIILTILALVMTIFPLFMLKYRLDMLAGDISRTISVSGQTGGFDAYGMAEEYGLTVDEYTVEIDPSAVTGETDSGTIIQLAGSFKVTLTMYREIGTGGVFAKVNIPLVSVSKGRSEVYWKELAEQT